MLQSIMSSSWDKRKQTNKDTFVPKTGVLAQNVPKFFTPRLWRFLTTQTR